MSCHPQPPVPVRISFPKWMIPCPTCGLHYTIRGRVRATVCRQFRRTS